MESWMLVVLLSCFGVGAAAAAMLVHRLRERRGFDVLPPDTAVEPLKCSTDASKKGGKK